MKKIKRFAVVMGLCGFLLLSGCESNSLETISANARKEVTKELKKSVKKKVNVELTNALESTDLSKFTGKNISILPKNELLSVSLKKHVDGDTTHFLLEGYKIKVRYLLIDTPETVKPNTDPEPFGYEASNRTKELLENANKIEIMLDKGERKDHYERVLAYVFVDGELVQDILVKEGLAKVAYVKEPSTKYSTQLTTSEKEAKKSYLGLWSVEN